MLLRNSFWKIEENTRILVSFIAIKRIDNSLLFAFWYWMKFGALHSLRLKISWLDLLFGIPLTKHYFLHIRSVLMVLICKELPKISIPWRLWRTDSASSNNSSACQSCTLCEKSALVSPSLPSLVDSFNFILEYNFSAKVQIRNEYILKWNQILYCKDDILWQELESVETRHFWCNNK